MVSVLQVEYVGTLAPYDYEERVLAQAGATLTVTRCADENELVVRARDADVIWLEWTPRVSRALLEQLPRCGLVMRWGVGYDQIDVAAATELGIAVANAPTYCTDDVAEHTVGMMLALSRQIVVGHEGMRNGLWPARNASIRRLRTSTVGIIGLGRIGRRVAELAAAFGAKVLAYDLFDTAAEGVENVGLSTLLAGSDFVSLHVPVSDATRKMINAATLAEMKPGAYLVNASRGGLIEEADLIDACTSGALAGAALDVFETEPLPPDHPLRKISSVILTPHQAASSERSVGDLRREMSEATVNWVTRGWTPSIVNPEIRGRQRGLVTM